MPSCKNIVWTALDVDGPLAFCSSNAHVCMRCVGWLQDAVKDQFSFKMKLDSLVFTAGCYSALLSENSVKGCTDDQKKRNLYVVQNQVERSCL